MNIGIVTTWFERGAAYVSKQFMDVLQATDKVYIYARGGEKYAQGNPLWDLPNVYWSKRNTIKGDLIDYTYIHKKEFVNWIQENKIEALLFNEQQLFEPLLWCKELKVKTFAYIDYYTEATIPLFDIYDGLICNTKRHAFAFRHHKNVQYLKWGTDIELYQPSTTTNEPTNDSSSTSHSSTANDSSSTSHSSTTNDSSLTSHSSATNDSSTASHQLVFFHSAGMAPFRKGTDVLLSAFYAAENRHKAKLIIHTQVSLKSKFPQLSSMIDAMISDSTLEIIEKTVPAPGLYHLGDVYVYPSRLDGIGLTLMESTAAGLACITIDNAPMNEFVADDFGKLCEVDYYYARKDGYYWPMSVASEASLTQLLTDFIGNKYDINAMKSRARAYAVEHLNFSTNCAALHNIIANTQFSEASPELYTNIKTYSGLGIKKFYDYIYPIYWIYRKLKNAVSR